MAGRQRLAGGYQLGLAGRCGAGAGQECRQPMGAGHWPPAGGGRYPSPTMEHGAGDQQSPSERRQWPAAVCGAAGAGQCRSFRLVAGALAVVRVPSGGPATVGGAQPSGPVELGAFCRRCQWPGQAGSLSKKSELPKLLVQEFAIQQGQVQLSDQLGGAHERFNLSPVNFRLTDLSTLPENGAYTLHAVLADGAQFDWKGSLRLQPLQSSGEARVRGFRLASIWDYVKPQFAVAPPKGELALQARYQFDLSGKQAQLTVAPFAAKLNHLQLTAPSSGSVIRLPQLALNNGHFDLQRHAVNLGQVTLSGAQIALQRQSNGLIDWQAALPPSKPTAPSPAATPAAPWSVQLPSLRLENWALDYTDHGFAQPLQVNGRLPLLTAQMALTPKTGLQLKDVTVALADWQLGAQHAKPVVTLQQAHLAASQFSLQQHTLQPGKLSLSGLEVLAERNRQGRINLQQLLQPAGAVRPAVAKAVGNAKAAPAWKLHYPPLELTDSRLQWNDASPAQPVKLALEAVSATLEVPEHQ
ncbi:DUF748 domain-containing protein [Paludibacterium sp. dN 18-1]|uniref:DUF748 domain-containing protein n=1 Tax=Paludibacterium denitrificans TaxID=2675226 RepID=A0A844G8M7_9NEIS|nr:DUF748 domain-containing protein [Paludibacterium denitrificans]